jgi:hypothetical protein
MMNEPSVLDYVKSRLAFWKKSTIVIPSPEDEQPEIPWLLFLPFMLAFAAQVFLEPPSTWQLPAAVLYGLAAIISIVAVWVGQIGLAEPARDDPNIDDMEMRWQLALGGLLALMASFLLFGTHTFNAINVMIWLFAIAAILAAFFVFGRERPIQELVDRLRVWLRQPAIHIPLSAWVLALVVVLAVVAYFRFYDLGNLPKDMVSDHAEKLLDISDVLNGRNSVFFVRNTGREPFQFYWTALIIKIFNSGLSFLSLKIGTAIVGLITLYYIYRLGMELGGRWVALYALFFAGIAYWPNIISRIGLRFPLYPFCVAPVMFYLLRGLRTNQRNYFIWAGLWLGIGLNGYTSSRIVPGLVVAAVVLYVLHRQSKGLRKQSVIQTMLLLLVAFAIFVPLFRFAIDFPQQFNYRSLTRIAGIEQPLPGPAGSIFLSNTWNALSMFFINNGDVWVHSVPFRPALDVVTAGLFFVGVILLLARYLKQFHWRDLFLLVSIPILLLPSILSLAFPNENPNLNRTAGAYVPVFLIVALAFDALVNGIRRQMEGPSGVRTARIVGGILALVAVLLNYNLFFGQYRQQYDQAAWNTAEMGQVMRGFSESVGSVETTYVVGFPYWVDTRLVAINAGAPAYNPEVIPSRLVNTVNEVRAKLFMLSPQDTGSLDILRKLYPDGRLIMHESAIPGKEFILFTVPARTDLLP